MPNERIDIDAIKSAAQGRWVEILMHFAIPGEHLDGKHRSCPKCGGKDRFRAFPDVNQTGGVFCNQCFSNKNGDGISTLQWWLNEDFPAVARRLANYLGLRQGVRLRNSVSQNGKSANDPAKHLRFHKPAFNTTQAALFCRHKKPATPAALELCGARLATYRGEHPVVALPVRGKASLASPAALPIGYAMMPLNGRTLPVYRKNAQTGKLDIEWKKVKLTAGSQAGWIGQVDLIESATHVWKVEGLSDLLALLSQPLPAGHIVLTNAFGAKENPLSLKSSWLAESLKNKTVYVLHDCDRPGQDGALGWSTDDGKQRPGWAPVIATHAKEVRNVKLPYPVVPDHGPDLRDWFNSGGTIDQLLDLAAQAEITTPSETTIEIREAVDDPHRLARANLAKLRKQNRDLKFWRDEWYVWKGPNYRRITQQEFRSKLNQSIKEEFDAEYQKSFERWKNRQGSQEGNDEQSKDKPPIVKKVNKTVVTNVMEATSGIAVVSSSVEPMTWLPDRSRRHYISMANGIVDLDELLADGDEYLLPHSPDWFSTVALPYPFEPEAACEKWLAFLEYNLEGDKERISQLQEWAGYLLLPDTGQQKFLLLEGEGSNGKSVYLAAITAMLGEENVSNVPLEVFGDRFSRTETLNKLANVAGDCEEMDKVAEGYIKSFTSGDRMYFDRKGVTGINCVPTARLMVSCNERPKFRDRSRGIWRRMLLIPWRLEIPSSMKVRNMDKPAWWRNSGELPGIFWWALQGLHRLREQGEFTHSSVAEAAMSDYQIEMNSARAFLTEFVEETDPADNQFIRSDFLYKLYAEWSKSGNLRPFGRSVFGKEVNRVFQNSEKAQRSESLRDGKRPRHWVYKNLIFSNDEISGISTSDEVIFSSENGTGNF